MWPNIGSTGENVRIVFQEASHENWYYSGIRISITIMFPTGMLIE
jgi:phenylpyruvate tautomerase PptA (4-oxalocrotonate tautomerase family)